jgi:hypothetical protein
VISSKNSSRHGSKNRAESSLITLEAANGYHFLNRPMEGCVSKNGFLLDWHHKRSIYRYNAGVCVEIALRLSSPNDWSECFATIQF